MNYLKYELSLSTGNTVKVELKRTSQCTSNGLYNFQAYQNGRQHRYYGGLATVSPFVVRPPHSGHWYLAIDLGGSNGRINASVSVI